MRIFTDIPVDAPESPDPGLGWRHGAPPEALRALFAVAFPDRPRLFETEAAGEKLGARFPLVLWRGHARNSQLDTAFTELGQAAATGGCVVFVARRGSGFHGHFDRQWLAAPRSLQVTVLVPNAGWPVARVATGLPLVPILAVAGMAEGLAGPGDRVRVKWINDVLLDGHKFGGALSRSQLKGDRVGAAAFGMGMNLGPPPEDLVPNVFVPSATGLPVDGLSDVEVLKRLLSACAAELSSLEREGSGPLLHRYRRLSAQRGRAVRVFADGPGLNDRAPGERPLLAHGVAGEVTDELALPVDGVPCHSGRLAFEEDCRAFGLASPGAPRH